MLVPPDGFRWWLDAAGWAISQYEPCFTAGPNARTMLGSNGNARPVINLSSYNYLAMAGNPVVIKAMQDALTIYGTGACGPPMLSGRTDVHVRLEERLASFLRKESATLFNTGFTGGLAAISGLARRGDVVVADVLAHMCLVDGVKLSGARLDQFQHNSAADLDRVLGAHKGKRRLVVVDGVYSMDGDMADLPALLDVAEAHGVPLFVDEAHSILACGPGGGGVAEHFGVQQRVASSSAPAPRPCQPGRFAVGARETLHYMRYYAHPYTFLRLHAPLHRRRACWRCWI